MGGTSAVFQDIVDHVLFPNFQKVHWLKAVLQAGDTLFIPHSYWHQVNSHGRNLAVNFWWGHTEDWRWWNPRNSSEWNVRGFGSPGAIPFDELKTRAPESLPCTPLPEGETMEHVKFVDEGAFKQYLTRQAKKEAKAAAKRKAKTVPQSEL